MITIAHEDGYYRAVVFNEFTLQDFREFENYVVSAAKVEGPVNLLVDLQDMAGYTLDMAMEEIRFSKGHRQEIGKIAVVTTDQWVTWSAWLSRLMTEAELQVFEDADEAVVWLLESATT
ncbi:SpoIIAA-like [Formivibrio citricus]|uniref:SpoIIAA-like n=1 Tax=Formivibrio citricus TaxID=83765 RepID=A0A1I4WEC3_9NEIS|nr:STAS/SEC14 domain-containing protein [Formivibrio citricus]SFN12154.1 SpoIIAA-like [Formivibrio citricus]